MTQTTPVTETTSRELDELRERVIAAIKNVYDPEIPVSVYEMGLIYRVEIEPDSRDVQIDMTLTTPSCPSAQALPEDVKLKVEAVEGLGKVYVDVIWDPPWSQDMMSEVARFELGID